jgi:GNAT superfamily N-acetyltransferase
MNYEDLQLPKWLKYSPQLDFTPAVVLALKGALEIIGERGYEPRLIIRGDQEAVWFEDPHDGDKPLGCIVFTVDGEGSYSRIWIYLSYTVPEARRKGVHAQLWMALERIARARGVAKISGAVRADNEPMSAAAKSRGRVGQYVMFEKVLLT